jgi:hypothetical protein
MERFKCPFCDATTEMDAVELSEIGIPYCPECPGGDVEMEIMDDEPKEIISYKSMFIDGWETLNESGEKLSNEIRKSLRPIVWRHVTSGFKTIDIEHIVLTEASLMCAEMRLKRNMTKRKAVRTLKKKGG